MTRIKCYDTVITLHVQGVKQMTGETNVMIGHNRREYSAEHLKMFIQRIEKLEEEKAALAADIREVYGEAKATGYDPKIMRQVIKLRKMDAADREEQESMIQVYIDAVGY